MKKFVARILIAIGVIFLIISILPVTDWWARQLGGAWRDPHGPTLIVLGSDDLADGTLGLHSYWRAVYAARIWREGGVQKIILCGAAVGASMKTFLVAQGVPESAIEVEDRSISTHENAMFVKDMAKSAPGPLILVTSEYHMLRARRVFERVGVPVLPQPIPDILKQTSSVSGRWSAFPALCVETAKIAYYRVKGWI